MGRHLFIPLDCVGGDRERFFCAIGSPYMDLFMKDLADSIERQYPVDEKFHQSIRMSEQCGLSFDPFSYSPMHRERVFYAMREYVDNVLSERGEHHGNYASLPPTEEEADPTHNLSMIAEVIRMFKYCLSQLRAKDTSEWVLNWCRYENFSRINKEGYQEALVKMRDYFPVWDPDLLGWKEYPFKYTGGPRQQGGATSDCAKRSEGYWYKECLECNAGRVFALKIESATSLELYCDYCFGTCEMDKDVWPIGPETSAYKPGDCRELYHCDLASADEIRLNGWLLDCFTHEDWSHLVAEPDRINSGV